LALTHLQCRGTVVLRFHELENTRSIKLNAEQRKNIYLITKESLNNSIKRSGASLLQIEFLHNSGEIAMSIRDNGRGFIRNTTYCGNGLKNMKGKAEDISGSLTLQSENESGTHIVLQIPLQTKVQ